MCNCKNITSQSKEAFNRMVTLEIPNNVEIRFNNPENKKRTHIGIDSCIAKEIQELWKQGIVTTGCCCGHNNSNLFSYIGVKKEFIIKMKELNYKTRYNPMRPDDEDSFIPKSI